MSNITLPRAVALHLREALMVAVTLSADRHTVKAAHAALDAALAEPPAKPEPVHPGYVIGSHWLETAYSRIAAGEAEADVLTEVLGARGWAKREPATDEQIVKAGGECAVVDNEYLLDFRDGFRAAERFHGITKEDKT
jgi:hypothetical protein